MTWLRLHAATVDLERGWADLGDHQERLTSRECALLRYLAAHRHRVVGRDELLAEVWGYSDSVVSRACDSAVARLRTKIEADPARPESLITHHGTGYRLLLASDGPTEEPAPEPAPAAAGRRFSLGGLAIDLDRGRIEGPHPASLTATEIEILALLWAAKGLPVDRDLLQRRIWGSAAGRPATNSISRLRRKIEPDPSSPSLLLTTATGYRLALDPESPPAEAHVEGPADALPPEVDARFGRASEIAEIAAMVADGRRIVTLVGPGGVGKTRLAIAAAHAIAASGTPVRLVDLTEARTLARLCAGLADALRIPLDNDDPIDRISRSLEARGRALLVLDNLEGLPPEAVAALGALAARAPSIALLGTSRVRLRLRGEVLLEIGPLSTADGVALFVDRAPRPPDPSDLGEVERLVDALDGLPLAIELAAARTRVLPVRALRERLGRRLELLSGGGPDRPERHRSLRASLDASWGLLSPTAADVLAQLSVFEGSLTAEAAEQVLRPSGQLPVFDALEELIDASLLGQEPSSGRLTMLSAVRAHASERLDPTAPVFERHAAWYAEQFGPAALARLDGPEEIALRRALRAERDNLAAACRRSLASGRADHAAALAAAVWEDLEPSGPLSDGLRLLDELLAARLGGVLRARVSLCAGRGRAAIGDWEAALADLAVATSLAHEAGEPSIAIRAAIETARILTGREALDAAREAALSALGRADALGDRALQCRALDALAAVKVAQWLPRDALRDARAAAELALALDAPGLSAAARLRLGRICADLDQPAAARRELDQALVLARDLGDRRLEAQALVERGAVDRLSGRLDISHEALEAAVALWQRTGDRRGEIDALVQFGATLAYERRLDTALSTFERALATARQLGSPSLTCRAEVGLASVLTMSGQPGLAEPLFRSALVSSRALGDPRVEATALGGLAKAHRDRGELAAAASLYQAALAIHQQIGNRRSVAIMMSHVADLLSEEGRISEAIETYLGAITLHREAGNVRFEAINIHNLARNRLLLGEHEPAARLIEDAIARFEALGDPVWIGFALLTRAEIAWARRDEPGAREAIAAALARTTAERLAERLDPLLAALASGEAYAPGPPHSAG